MSSAAGPSGRRVVHDVEFHVLSLAQLSLDDSDVDRDDGIPRSDAEIALALSAEEARFAIMFESDRALAQALQEEEREGQAIPVAPRLMGQPTVLPAPQRTAPPDTTNTLKTSWVGGWLWSLVAPLITPNLPNGLPTSTSLARAPPAARSSRLTGHDCVICRDPIRGAEVRTPCGHYYDKACITDLFRAATGDESLFPPRCCRLPIPLLSVQPHLTTELMALFREKEKEFGTLKRVYCANPACSRFLGPVCEGWFKATISCPAPRCSTRTCNGCKGQANDTWHSCKPDVKDRDVIALGKTANWARCPGCDQMIELSMGCYHMTCRCKTEFCYLCRARWKTCPCTQWDENRLLHAAERRVDAQLAANRVAPPPAHRVVPERLPAQPIARVAARPVNTMQPHVPRVTRPVMPLVAHPVVPRAAHPVFQTPPTPVGRNNDVHGHHIIDERQHPLHPSGNMTTDRRFGPPTIAPGPSKYAKAPAGIPRLHVSAEVERERLLAEATARIAERRNRLRASFPTSQDDPINLDDSLRTEASKRIAERRTNLRFLTPSKIPANTARAAVQDNSPGTSSTGAVRPLSCTINAIDLHRAKLVREAVEELRVNHECKHKSWRYRHGGGVCETCHHNLPHYLFRCLGCQTLACNRCRRNRL